MFINTTTDSLYDMGMQNWYRFTTQSSEGLSDEHKDFAYSRTLSLTNFLDERYNLVDFLSFVFPRVQA